MASHLLRLPDREFEIKIREPFPNGDPNVGAYEHLHGEPLEELPVTQDEEKWLRVITKILEDIFGPRQAD